MFITLVVSALCLGCVYGLIALGYSTIYKASGLMNFAQGDFLTFGAYLGWTFYSLLNLPFIVSLLLTGVVMFLAGFLIEKGIVRTVLGKTSNSGVYIILATTAISLIIRNGCQLIWGTDMLNFPSIVEGFAGVHFGMALIPVESIVCVGASFICMVLLHFFMRKTKFGTAMRAAALDATAASSCGINVSLATGTAWGIASCIAALGGIFVGPLYGVSLTLGAALGRKGFAGAVFGGYGNMYGAMIGGIIIGFAETMIAGYVSSLWKDFFTYALLLFFLYVKPTGILNEKTLQD